ncbi:hypothetical protein V6Z11_D06G168900 [Gossypium hirsutum]
MNLRMCKTASDQGKGIYSLLSYCISVDFCLEEMDFFLNFTVTKNNGNNDPLLPQLSVTR